MSSLGQDPGKYLLEIVFSGSPPSTVLVPAQGCSVGLGAGHEISSFVTIPMPGFLDQSLRAHGYVSPLIYSCRAHYGNLGMCIPTYTGAQCMQNAHGKGKRGQVSGLLLCWVSSVVSCCFFSLEQCVN